VTIKRFYKGFNTRDYENSGGNFEIYNVKCVEADLLNEIFTVKGDRLMMPDFGTRIPLMVFEINDVYSQDIIREDLIQVFKNDPRVSLVELDIIALEETNVLVAIAKINYIEFNVTSDLRITINSQ
jgi:phage baseplate assembly protein W